MHHCENISDVCIQFYLDILRDKYASRWERVDAYFNARGMLLFLKGSCLYTTYEREVRSFDGYVSENL